MQFKKKKGKKNPHCSYIYLVIIKFNLIYNLKKHLIIFNLVAAIIE